MTKQTVFPVEQIEPFTGDSVDTARYQYCDFCGESCVLDIANGIPVRALYRALDNSELIVCEDCLPSFFAGDEE